MLRSVLIFVLVLFTTNIFFAQAPAWQWGKDANSSNPEGAWDVAYDTFSGNAYVGGSFQGNLSAVYGSSFTSSYGNLDGFLAKYDPSGNVLWAIKLGGTNVDEVRGVATDGTGNVYVTGYFSGTADFDPSAATFNLISSGGQDGFLAKYSSTGTFIWAAKFSGSGDEDSWKMSADANGIYVTGSYQTPAVTFGSYSSVITKSTTVTDSQYNMYGAKYNSNGTVQWVISGGGDKDDIGYNVIADANSIYFIGSYNDDITFNNSSGIAGSILPAQQNNKTQVYILAVTQLGVLSWQTNITSNTGGDMVAGTGITQDATNLYVTGYFDGNINFKYPSPTLTQNLSGGGSLDLYLAKLSKTGTFIWNTAATGNGNGEQIGRTLEVDGSGNIILGGCYTNGLNYTAAGGPNFTASGAHDIFITSYSPTGSFLWSTRAGGNTRDYLNGMAVDDAGAVFVCGESDGQMVIGTTTLTSGGGKNVFVGKLGCSVITNNTITASQTICIGSAPSTFTGSIPVGGTLYSWESSLDALTWTTTSGTYTNQNYTAPSLTATTYYRRIVSSTGSCSASSLISNTITINADAVPSVANAGSNQTVCASTATLNGNIPAIGSGIWSVITGTSSVTTSSNPSSPVTAINTGTNSFLWTISNGICPASSSTVTIIRSVLPSSNAGANQTICTVTATMAATTPTTGAGSWSLLSGTGSIITPTNSSSQITGLGTGTNNFVWTVSNGVCTAATSTATIFRDIQPTANAGANQTICAVNATMSATTPTTGTGSWTLLSGSGSIITPTSSSSQITGLGTGTNNFVWTVSNGVCTAATSTATIFRDIQPTANAGANQTICAVNATMAATIPTTGAGSWSLLSGTGSIITPTNSSSQITGLGTGTNNFVWTVSNGVCTAATSMIAIIRDLQPTANAGANQTICAVNATMAATTPTTGAGSWSLLSGTGSIITPTNSSSQITGLGTGTNNFVWTVSNGVCTAATSTVVVVRDIQPIANAGANQTICAVTATMAATTPTTGTGSWSLLSGTGIIATSNSSTSQITGLGTGTNNFMWTVSNGVCTAAISTVTLIRNAGLTAFAGSNQSVCTSSATLNASIPPIGNGSWSVLTGASSVSINTDPASQITSLSFGLNTYLWSVSNSSCPTATSVVNIWRDTSPFADAGTSQNICSSTATLTAISPTLGTGLWSILGGTAAFAFFNNPLATLSSVATGTNTFMWTVTNGACISTSTVSVIRDTPQSAIAGTNQTICTSTATLGASGPVSGNGTWSFISGTATVSSFTNPASQVTSINTGTTTFLWTVNNGACPSTTATVDIMRDIQPSSFAGADQTVCATSAAFAATSPSVGSGIWSPLSGGATIVAPGNPLSPVTGIATGTNSFLWTVSNGVCPTATSIVNIFKEIPPGNANAGPDFTVCSSSCTLSASSATPGNAGWSVYLGTSAINSTNNPGSNVSNLSIGLNQFIWKNINGSCPPSLDTVSVFFTTPLLSASAGQDQELCSTVCTLAANNPGYGIWSVLAGGSVISNISGATTSVTSLGAGNNIFIWSVTKSFCPTTEDTVVIHRDENPSLSNAGPDQRVCGADANLSAISATIGKGQWKILEGASQIGDATLFQTPITGLSTGSNKFVWIVTNGVCLAASDTLLILSDALPSEALAGADLLVCQDEINLDANVPTVGKGTWSLLSGTCSIMQPSNNITAISGLKEGVQLLEWTVVNGVCPEKSDTVQITRTFTPINPDAGDNQVLESSTTRLSATIPQAGVGTWTILSGSCEFSDIHDKDASVSKLSFGNTLIRWTIVNKSCPDVSDDILIHVKDLNIPNAFSPNGDGINDRFVITSLNYYKEVKISIFNRWGNLLYHNAEYHNDWAGNSLNNERLADDTYYYIIEIPELKNFTGFIMIKRDL